jgi:hypothetical protein
MSEPKSPGDDGWREAPPPRPSRPVEERPRSRDVPEPKPPGDGVHSGGGKPFST